MCEKFKWTIHHEKRHKPTHRVDFYECRYIQYLYAYSGVPPSVPAALLSNHLLIVFKCLIRTTIALFFILKSLSFLLTHPPPFGNCCCKHVDKWPFESPVTNDIYSPTKRLFEWPPWACFTPTSVISGLMAKHLRLSAHP